jgi:hypothetical protein
MSRPASYSLIVALPNPGQPGSPRGLFFQRTAEGHARAEEFARREDRPGWGVFETLHSFKEASWEVFEEVVQHALEHPPS